MQGFNLKEQSAKLTGIKIREELKDDKGLPDVSLSFLMRTGSADLAKFSPELRDAIYKPGEQPELDGTNDKASLRFPELGKLNISKKVVGATFRLHYGVGDVNGQTSDPISESTQVDSFTLDPQEGGTVLVGFRVWGKFTGPQIGNLALTVGRDTSISIDSPEPAQGSLIDGSGDGDWPFPKEGAKSGTAADADEGDGDADPFAGTDLARKQDD